MATKSTKTQKGAARLRPYAACFDRECFQTQFVILSAAKDPWQRAPDYERKHGFFTSFRMTGFENFQRLKIRPDSDPSALFVFFVFFVANSVVRK